MSGAKCLRRIEIRPEVLAMHLVTGSTYRVTDGIPDGAEVVDAGYDPAEGVFYLTLEHRSWTLVTEGEDIPTMDVTFKELQSGPLGELDG